MKITIEDMEHWRTCHESKRIFRKLFGRSTEITPTAILRWKQAIRAEPGLRMYSYHPGRLIMQAFACGLRERPSRFWDREKIKDLFVLRVATTSDSSQDFYSRSSCHLVGMRYSAKRCAEAITQVLRALGRKG